MFRAIYFFAHLQERKTVNYSLWLPCSCSQGLRPTTIWEHHTTCCNLQICAPDDGQKKKLPETCWADLKINKLLLLYLVGPLLYLNRVWFEHKQVYYEAIASILVFRKHFCMFRPQPFAFFKELQCLKKQRCYVPCRN